MSSSSKTIPSEKDPASQTKSFVYKNVGSAGGAGSAPSGVSSLWGDHDSAEANPEQQARILEEQNRAREKQAYQKGIQETEARLRKDYEQAVDIERKGLLTAVQSFASEREAYYNRVETEVVQLSVAIARKILHRESQMDPLVLAGAVRVALEKVGSGTYLRLRIHPAQLEIWKDYFENHPEVQPVPELKADPSLQREQLVLETALGITDLSLESQLKEVERGFMDLLAHKPQESS